MVGSLERAQLGLSLLCQLTAKVDKGSVAAETLLEGGLLVRISGEPAIPEESPEPDGQTPRGNNPGGDTHALKNKMWWEDLVKTQQNQSLSFTTQEKSCVLFAQGIEVRREKRSPIKIFFVVGWTVNLSSKVDHQEMDCGWLVGALMLLFES